MTDPLFPELEPGHNARLPAGWLRDNVGRCRSCQAWIVWAVNEKSGKRTPFNAEPPAGKDQLIVHWATCPEAEQWRSKNSR